MLSPMHFDNSRSFHAVSYGPLSTPMDVTESQHDELARDAGGDLPSLQTMFATFLGSS